MLGGSDRNLLVGIIALQMDFITRDALIAAMNAWVLDKATPLGQILEKEGALSQSRRSLLEALCAYEAGEFRKATGILGRLVSSHGDDGPTFALLARTISISV